LSMHDKNLNAMVDPSNMAYSPSGRADSPSLKRTQSVKIEPDPPAGNTPIRMPRTPANRPPSNGVSGAFARTPAKTETTLKEGTAEDSSPSQAPVNSLVELRERQGVTRMIQKGREGGGDASSSFQAPGAPSKCL